jgi:hypothetical protein
MPRLPAAGIALIVVLLVNLALQLNARYWDAQSDGYWGLRRVRQCEALGRAPDALFLGSSRAMYGVNPAVVDATVAQGTGTHTLSCNAGILGSTIEQDYYTFKRMLEDGYTPRLLVENIWEQNLNVNAEVPADDKGDHIAQILRLADLDDAGALRAHFTKSGDPDGKMRDFVADKTIPLYRDRAGLLWQLCGDLRAGPCDHASRPLDDNTISIYQRTTPQGWVPDTDATLGSRTPDQLAAKLAKDTTYFHSLLRNFVIGGHQPEYLARLLDLARSHGVRVVLITSPLHPSFFSYLDRPTDWALITGYLQNVAAAHGAAYYDESRAPGFTDDDFADQHHLSPMGATAFSAWLAAAVVGPELDREQ